MSDSPEALPEGTLISHLLELRSRLLRAFIGVMIPFIPCAIYSNRLFDLVSKPLVSKLPPGQKLIATTVTGTFTAPLKLAFIIGLLLAMPYVLYQAWAFVAPGLYRREKRFAVPLLVSSILLFYLGVGFAYEVIFPLVFRFFVSTTPHNVLLMADVNNYLSFALHLFVGFGVAFETPVVVVLLVLTNLVSLQKLRSARRYVLIIVFVIAAAITPPDMLSQTSMAVPMYLLYEGGLLFAAIMSRQKASAATASEPGVT
ncbi:MAG TPA: twin-arginine translocase subunit TatC [Steroidobacteraceae bacterium]|jgi:sec-independent protein translocase protein TatC|nr:twin-arginine translocase subunit TatC [Steroidobacteraceae bacterium]